MGKLSELSVWGGRRASHNETGLGTGGRRKENQHRGRDGTRLGRCSWPGSLMVPPIVTVVQGLPSLIYICEPCHSHLQAFVWECPTPELSGSLRAHNDAGDEVVRAAQWCFRRDIVVNIETDFFQGANNSSYNDVQTGSCGFQCSVFVLHSVEHLSQRDH